MKRLPVALKHLCFGLLAVLGLAAAASPPVAEAAPGRPTLTCTGAPFTWENTSVLGFQRMGDHARIEWVAMGHVMLDCGAGHPLTGQSIEIRQHVEAVIVNGLGGNDRISGQARTQILIGLLVPEFRGEVGGTATCTQGGTCNITAVYTGDANFVFCDGSVRCAARLHMTQAGLLDGNDGGVWRSLDVLDLSMLVVWIHGGA